MLTSADDLFHQPRYQDSTWTETSYWTFLIPEEKRVGYIYFLFKPNLGVAQSQVVIYSKHCKDISETDYWDSQVHLPMPRANLDNLTLASGLSLRVLEPLKRYRVDYDGGRGTELHLEFEGLVPPVETGDTRIKETEGFAQLFQAMALAGTAHLEQPMMVTGELILNGEQHRVAHPAIRDRSWGPRPETGHRSYAWEQGNFGADFGFHVLGRLPSPNEAHQECHPFEGYILENGEIYAATDAKGEIEREGYLARRLVYEVTDRRGKTFVFRGEAVASVVMTAVLNVLSPCGLIRWECDGRVGWGDSEHGWGVDTLQREREVAQGR